MIRFLLVALALLPTLAYSWQTPKEILNSVVLLDGPGGRGTGFHVRAKSDKVFILTNKHVCMGVADADGTMRAYMESGAHPTVKVVVPSLSYDICLVESAGGEPLKFGDEPEYKDLMTIYGHPGGGPLAMSMGPIESRTDDEFYAGALILPGSSGSPVLNEKGRVAGIVFAYFTDTHKSIFLTVERIKEFLANY